MDTSTQDLWKDIEEARAEKSAMVRAWDLTRCFVEGKQHVFWNEAQGTFSAMEPAPSERNRTTINKMLGIYRNVQSRLAASMPGIGCLPTSSTTEAVLKAMACEHAAQAYLLSGRTGDTIHKKIRQFSVMWGAAWLVPRYNPKTQTIETQVYSNYDVFFDKGAMDVEDSDWVGLRSFHVASAIKEAYPKFEKQIDAAASATREGHFNTVPDKRVELFNVYERASGLHKVVIRDQVLWSGPYPYGKFPVQRIAFTDIPFVPFGAGLMFSLIDIQNQYNKGRKLLFDSIESMANPGWLIPKNCGVRNDVDTSKPGWRMPYNPLHGKPEQADLKPMPSYVFENLAMIGVEFQDVSNIHDSAAGKRPNGIEAGVALQMLVQQDVTVLEDAMENMELGMAAHMEDVLRYMKFFYDEPREIRLLSTAGGLVHRTLQATDLVENPQIAIEAGTMFRATAEDREKRALSLLQAQLINAREAKQAILFRAPGMSATKKMAGLFHAREMLEACKQITAESPIIDIEILPVDDLEAFEMVFHEFIETPEYYMTSPEAQETIRNVLLRVRSPDATPEQFAQEANRKVWPVQVGNAMEAANLSAVLGGQPAGVNAAMEAQRMQALRAEMREVQGIEHAQVESKMKVAQMQNQMQIQQQQAQQQAMAQQAQQQQGQMPPQG